jgi:hypothetical protein
LTEDEPGVVPTSFTFVQAIPLYSNVEQFIDMQELDHSYKIDTTNKIIKYMFVYNLLLMELLKNYNIVCIGSDAGEKYFVEDEVDNKKEFLLLMDNLHEFHGENFGAILLTLGLGGCLVPLILKNSTKLK